MVSVSISDSPEDVMDAVMKKTADTLFDSGELSPEKPRPSQQRDPDMVKREKLVFESQQQISV